MVFPEKFISAPQEAADFERRSPAPYIRKRFYLDKVPDAAQLLITGLGFYRVFVNGKEFTKCILAPYISNPDDMIYYDTYEVNDSLQQGENVIGIILGNGMQNAYGGFVWNFDKAAWRSAPMTALRLEMRFFDGTCTVLEGDDTFLTHPSPLVENELRSGETYDARLEMDGWNLPGSSEDGWEPAREVRPPRGKPKLCTASLIRFYESRHAVSICPYQDGYLYDFGVDAAGVCELKIKGEPGQRIDIFYGEWYRDGILEKKNLMFPEFASPYADRVQDFCYICRGDREETYLSYFTYYGFRYAYVRGIRKDQAQKELLTYHVCGGDFKEVGSFTCSSDTVNQLWNMTRRSVLSNFLWFPTDCPHREKNGWTGDAALSAEHMLMSLSVEDSLREWLLNVQAAQAPDGELPGIVPTGGWGFGNGPAWDQVIVEIPYQLYRLRGDLETAKSAAPFIFRYLYRLSVIRNERGLVDSGLGDWCEAGKSGGGHKAPVEVTGTAVGAELSRKAKLLFQALGMEDEAQYAGLLQNGLRAAFRKYLIDFSVMRAAGNCQTSQAMAIACGMFEKAEQPEAFRQLVEMIHSREDHLDAGALGLRVLFHVLSGHGEADLAYKMITRKDYPSYGNWIARGATALWEDFLPPEADAHSQNHHFFGDISNWFIQSIAGIQPNPWLEDANEILVAPHFISRLSSARAGYRAPLGSVEVEWKREADNSSLPKILLRIGCQGRIHGEIRLPQGWEFTDGFREKKLAAGEYALLYTGGKRDI